MFYRLLKYVLRGFIGGSLVMLISIPPFADARDDDPHDGRNSGALFVMTNATSRGRGNEIVMYRRAGNGNLSLVGSFPTGDAAAGDAQLGSGPAPTAQIFQILAGLPLVSAQFDGFGSSNSLILSHDRRCLFAVNAGSNSISSLRILGDGLSLASVVDSQGVFPVSLTEHNNILYVLNAGETGSLAGFRVHGSSCSLGPVHNSVRSLAELTDSFPTPAPNEVLTTPAQISFAPDGKRLVLSIKGSDGFLPNGRIAVFPVMANGLLADPVVTPGNYGEGTGGPFSFVFDGPRTLIVVHANSGTVASLTINPDNSLSVTSGPLLIDDFATCWIMKAGPYVYTASFGAPSGVRAILGQGTGLPDLNGAINSFRLDSNSGLQALGVRVEYPDPSAVLGFPATGNHAIDMHVIGRYLYFIQPRVGMVGRLTINDDGSLSNLVNFGGLAAGLEPFPGLNPGIDNFLERCFLQDQDPSVLNPECLLGSAQGITGF